MEIKVYDLIPVPRELSVGDGQDDIYLSIEIGNGQIGGTKVSLGDRLLAKGNLSQPTFLAKSGELIGQELKIETNILDVNNFTNMCVLTTTFFNQHHQTLYTKIDRGEASESGIASFNGTYVIRLLLLFLALMIHSDFSFAQKVNEIKFQDLETPSSPGFILLDNAPSAIERPTTPQGFGVSLLGLFQGSGAAMEIAPFWLADHPKLTAEKMYRNKYPMLHNFSVSVATVKSDGSSYLGAGFRTRLFQFFPKGKLGQLDAIKARLELALAELALAELDLKEIERLHKEYAGLIEKPVFTVDFAGAIAGGTSTSSFDDLEVNRWAAWLSANYRPKGGDLYATVLARYTNNVNFGDYALKADLVDIGARGNYDIGKLCLSLEYLHRLDLTTKNYKDNRVAIIGSYQISDNFFITSTFGKNFSGVNNIIALAGINFGFSKSKVKAF